MDEGGGRGCPATEAAAGGCAGAAWRGPGARKFKIFKILHATAATTRLQRNGPVCACSVWEWLRPCDRVRSQPGTVLRVRPTAVIAVAVTACCSCRPRPGILRLGKDCRAPSDMSRQTAPDLSLFFSLTRCGDTHDNIRIDKHSIPSLTARHYNDARRCRCSRRCRCCHYAVNKGHTGPHASCSAYWSWLDCRSSRFCASSFQAGSFRVIAQRIVQCHAGINLNT